MIRRINEKDIQECVEVIKESFMTVAEEFHITPENAPRYTAFAMTSERLEYQYKEGRPMFAFYDENEKIIGYYSLHVFEDKECEINNLCVLPEYRHKKIGKQLLEHSFQQAKDLGCDQMLIGMMEENRKLRQWYESHGAVHIGTK